MEARELQFTQEEDSYISDTIISESSELVIRIEYEKSGLTELERSITGNDFMYVVTIMAGTDTRNRLEFNISGIVPGQQLRLRFKQSSKPNKIYVLP
jgi:hypothetical protein